MDVSFIIPLYKGKKFIKKIVKTIEENKSVLDKHGMNIELEIVFINDDPTEAIDKEEWQKSVIRDNIILISNAHNLGIHRTRLEGLKKSHSEYVIFLDQDDIIAPDYLLNQLKCMNHADAVLCNGICRGNRMIYESQEQQRGAISKEIYLNQCSAITSPGQMMIRREAIPEDWIKYPLYENGSDDVFLWVLMLRDGKRFSINPSTDYYHAEDGNNASLNFFNMKKSIEELGKVVQENKLLVGEDNVRFEAALQKRVIKLGGYIRLLDNWEKIMHKLRLLIESEKPASIAVYGYGIIGKKLLQNLEDMNIMISCVVDKSSGAYSTEKYEVCSPSDIHENVDWIILTPLFAEDEIRVALKGWNSRIISLKELC